ncbi:hypothetical protein [Aliihoeflea sp. PC F10.4]
MQVKITKSFHVDSASGRTDYVKGQIVPNGQKNWIDKGLAIADAPKPEPKSAD